MIDVSNLVIDPFCAQSFTVTRRSGAFVAGDFVSTSETFGMSGSIQPVNSKDLSQVPEGDRVEGMLKVYSVEKLHTTALDDAMGEGMLSDEITYKGGQWKVFNIPSDFSDFGYYKAILARKRGA